MEGNFNRHLGSKLRLRRLSLGLTQTKVAQAINVTFQQIQKYERGANRIGASRMFDLSTVLDVPVSFFFEDMSEEIKKRDAEPIGFYEKEQVELEKDPLTRRETLELVRAYYRIDEPSVRKRIFELVKSLARAVDEG